MAYDNSTQFDPKEDGFSFPNWKDPSDLTWAQYIDSYLGIPPTEDWVNATVECGWFEKAYKNCTTIGHCAGISLLALAIFKNGGYMGFCSPAKIYLNPDGNPQMADLHKALDILHARQFGMPSVENYLESFPHKDADRAFQLVKTCLEKGDFPLLSLATGLGHNGHGHVVIPYAIKETGGKKIMYIWDCKHPYNDADNHYNQYNPACQLVIHDANNWDYTSELVSYTGGDYIYAIPMSIWLPRPRVPSSAIDLEDLILKFIFSGGAVTQITDDKNRRFYKTDSFEHTSLDDLETDETKRIPHAAQWIWLDETSRPLESNPCELYFFKYKSGRLPSLNMKVIGDTYSAMIAMGRNIINIQSELVKNGSDRISIFNFTSISQRVEIETGREAEKFTISQIRHMDKDSWRKFDIDLQKTPEYVPVTMSLEGNFDELHVDTGDNSVTFSIDIYQKHKGILQTRKVQGLSTKADELLRIYPKKWEDLKSTKINKERISKERKTSR